MLISGCGNKPARSAAIAEASSATTLSWRVHSPRAPPSQCSPCKAAEACKPRVSLRRV